MNEYISREELIKALETDYNRSWCSKPQGVEEYVEGARDEYDAVLKIVSGMKSADVQPVKRGRWSECYTDSHHYSGICTVCGKASIRSIKENPLGYCPKCGARMDGETTYKPIALKDIKRICSERQHCQDTEKGNCQFYDKNSGYCIFEDMPEDWNIEENKEKLINYLKNADVKSVANDRIRNLTDEETDIYNSQLEAEAETIEKVSLLSEKLEYKDPCKCCHNGVCEQCYYGYCSEEDKKKKWLENNKRK